MSAVKKDSAPTFALMSYLDAIVQAQVEELQRDPRVIVMGEDLQVYGGGKLVERFGPKRIWSMPISETGFSGMAVGAAMTGLRPIVDLSIASFMYLASDPIINQAAKLSYMTGGQIHVPVVYRCIMFYGVGNAAQHSDRPYPLFMNVPGLKIVCGSSPSVMKGLLKSAVRDDNPVMVFEDSRLWPVKENVSLDPERLLPLGKAHIVRPGTDVTIVAIAGAMRPAQQAAEMLYKEGISVELIDPCTLKPLDTDTIIASVAKTGRLVLVENAHRMVSASSEISAIVCEEAFDCLKKPIVRLTAPDVHVPYSSILEAAMYPQKDQVVAAVRKLM